MEILPRVDARRGLADKMVRLCGNPDPRSLCALADFRRRRFFFASFDSVQDESVAILTPHTAFEDPTTPPDALRRESIEIRALVFYD